MTTGPFVLLDDGRRGRLFQTPDEIVSTRHPEQVRPCLERLRPAPPRTCAGFLSYEAGHALEHKLGPLTSSPQEGEPPLLWFGLFGAAEEVDVEGWLPDSAAAWSGAPRPMVEQRDYEAALANVKEHIAAGDIYQANLTFQAEVATAGHPLALYASIRRRARVRHGGIVFTGSHWILSFSPELFFTLEKGRITTRPMKGTAVRQADPERDRSAIDELRADPKQRAENLMIVDLLRNDLSRIARPGTVKVPELFAVETYPTVHQMTSTVTAELMEGLGPVDVIEAIFPCGSITGAPKIRAMEIIGEVEWGRRGVYTGSIGTLAPGGEAEFNVAIRTLTMRAGEHRAVMGLGSGVVADSRAGDEWSECLAKGAFVADRDRSFDLIETMRFDPRDGVAELERHLARMKSSAEALGFAFDRHHARNELQAATFRVPIASRIRLRLSRSGAVAIEVRPLDPAPTEPVEVALAPLPVLPHDFRLRHKTSDRAFYDDARAASVAFEVLFTDQEGFLTEGSFTNIFVERDGTLLTPPLSRGLLPGVLRQALIEEKRAREADLTAGDLDSGLLIGNAARGLVRAILRG